MFFLTKMFKLRDKANPDEEKPFLDHLEDLRIMITRMALTLVIATLACFVFKDDLMSIIRRPVEQVWVEKHEATLPQEMNLTLDDWESALELANVVPALQQLDPAAAEAWWKIIGDEKKRRLVEATILYRSAEKLPESERTSFIQALPDERSEIRDIALKLLENSPSASLNAEGNLRLMSSLKPTETFMLTMKLAFFAGVVVSFPFLLYFLLQFILPGLKAEERKALWPALVIGFGLFLGGVLFAYFFVLPNVLTFFYEWGKSMGISNDWRIGYYIQFATTFVLIFGLAFELPVVVMTLVKLGLLSHTMMRETRSYAILAIFVIAAIITPTPDMATLAFLAVPMVILYEICIWLSYFHEKKRDRLEKEEEDARMKRLLADPEDDEFANDDHLLTGGDDEVEDVDDAYGDGIDDGVDTDEDEDDDYQNYPGEHRNAHEEDPDYDPLLPDEDLPEGEKDRDKDQ